MFHQFVRFAAVVMAALSFGPSYAHVLEAPPRFAWSPELWRDATVFGDQFRYFATIGAPVDIAAILVTALLALLLWRSGWAGWLALAGALCFAIALACWFALVFPANAVLATWMPGPVAEDFADIRNRWETGHMTVAAVKFIGVLAVAAAVIGRPKRS